jgi:molybdate/tungstate transport system substrate-binding protein
METSDVLHQTRSRRWSAIKTRILVLLLSILFLLLALVIQLAGCKPADKEIIPLKVSHAGSLIVPLQAMEKQFELLHPDIDIMLEGHGSIQVIRSVTELKQEVDVALVADSQLIPLLMYPVDLPDGSGPYAFWLVNFAANALGIAYTGKSPYSGEFSSSTWYEIMSRPDVSIGFSDPRIDSLGYRAFMTVQLAEDYYHDKVIFDKMIAGEFSAGIKVETTAGVTTITVPQLLKPSSGRVILRSYSIQILALLESGDVDFAFEYESVAKQRGLKFLPLPREINMSSPDQAEAYRQIQVKLDFQRFASVNPVFEGMPIIYGATIPASAAHRPQALLFLEYLLGSEGRRILKENYQPPLDPPTADFYDRIPAELKSLVRK